MVIDRFVHYNLFIIIIINDNKTMIESDEILRKLIELFQKFNTINVWSQITGKNDFQAEYLGKGNICDVIRCRLNPSILTKENTKFSSIYHNEIVVKILPDNIFIKYDPLEASVINTIICSNGIGPRLFYTDHQYKVYELIDGRTYNYNDDCNEQTVRKLARTLARFHRLNVPISNDSQQRWSSMIENLELMPFYDILESKAYLPLIKHDEQLRQEYYDFAAKIDIIKLNANIIRLCHDISGQSSFVFSHNDFNRNNRIVCNDHIKLIDLDYSTYYYRGYDLGRYFSNYRHRDDMFGAESFPTDHEMDIFLNEYRHEMYSLQQLRAESKAFTLLAYAVDTYFGLWQFTIDPNGSHGKYFLNVAKTRGMELQRLIQQFINDDDHKQFVHLYSQ
ncbi:uncharacterized protein LOC124500466 isoform X2 [Dermatophagoides farinae]|uniref:uncharacterized protein LOC124500466 isoform X2 n=1 Tax=Dermatophagoides farinae TaxID=6954 RepID=UPI001F1133ED|nr:probable ethanolamine kinase isoform X2 [Dermatophagoides farinae]